MIFIMPVWSYEEAWECKERTYSTIDKDTFHTRFHLWGGSARHLFAESTKPFEQQLEQVLSNIKRVENIYFSMESKFSENDADSRGI